MSREFSPAGAVPSVNVAVRPWLVTRSCGLLNPRRPSGPGFSLTPTHQLPQFRIGLSHNRACATAPEVVSAQ